MKDDTRQLDTTAVRGVEMGAGKMPETYMGPIPGYFERYRAGLIPMAPPTAETVPQPIPPGYWQCFYCRGINCGKFCTECGKPRGGDAAALQQVNEERE